MNYSFLKNRAKHNLDGNWGTAIIALLIAAVFSFVIDFLFADSYTDSGIFIFCIRLMIQGPISLGIALVFLGISRGLNPVPRLVFEGFRHWGKAFWLSLMVTVYIILWSILLVIPGIIAALSYSMAFYIMADEPDVTASEAIRRSKMMMRGHKTELFMLLISFIGWIILSLFTMGILFIVYVGPYLYATITEFYESLQERSSF
jgi:uncharacterized membrane protein